MIDDQLHQRRSDQRRLVRHLGWVNQRQSLLVRLYEVYKPIAKPSVNFIAGIAIDLAYGFILAGLFLLLLFGAARGERGFLRAVAVVPARGDERDFFVDDVHRAR